MCAEKEARIQDLQRQILMLTQMAFPNHAKRVDAEMDQFSNGSDENIDIPVSRAEIDVIASYGTHDPSDEGMF